MVTPSPGLTRPSQWSTALAKAPLPNLGSLFSRLLCTPGPHCTLLSLACCGWSFLLPLLYWEDSSDQPAHTDLPLWAESRLNKGVPLNLSSGTMAELSLPWRLTPGVTTTQGLHPFCGRYTKLGYRSTSGYSEPGELYLLIKWAQSLLSSLQKLSSCLDNYAELVCSFNNHHRTTRYNLCAGCCAEDWGRLGEHSRHSPCNVGLWLLNCPLLDQEPSKGPGQQVHTDIWTCIWRGGRWIEEAGVGMLQVRGEHRSCWFQQSSWTTMGLVLCSRFHAFSTFWDAYCVYRLYSSVVHLFYPKPWTPYPILAGLLLGVNKTEHSTR